MMDTLWNIILSALQHVQGALDFLFSPLHALGPVVSITVIAVVTAAAARLLSKNFKTRRYRELEKEFHYWYEIKQEALRLRDAEPEKAKDLGRNIDQAKLNKVYYDYFFEGLLNNLLTMYIPIFSMLGYVNATYRPQALADMFEKPYLFILPWFGGKQYEIGAAFWFVFCVLMFYIISFIIGLMRRNQDADSSAEESLSGPHARRARGQN